MEWVFPVFGFLVIGALTIAAIALWIWALVDCIQVPDDSLYQSGNKLIWVLVIVFATWIGAILYLLIGRPTHHAAPPPPATPGHVRVPPSPPGSLPPPPGAP